MISVRTIGRADHKSMTTLTNPQWMLLSRLQIHMQNAPAFFHQRSGAHLRSTDHVQVRKSITTAKVNSALLKCTLADISTYLSTNRGLGTTCAKMPDLVAAVGTARDLQLTRLSCTSCALIPSDTR